MRRNPSVDSELAVDRWQVKYNSKLLMYIKGNAILKCFIICKGLEDNDGNPCLQDPNKKDPFPFINS